MKIKPNSHNNSFDWELDFLELLMIRLKEEILTAKDVFPHSEDSTRIGHAERRIRKLVEPRIAHLRRLNK